MALDLGAMYAVNIREFSPGIFKILLYPFISREIASTLLLLQVLVYSRHQH